VESNEGYPSEKFDRSRRAWSFSVKGVGILKSIKVVGTDTDRSAT